jgi:hypothetical protein
MIDRDFIVSREEFLNLFSTAYITAYQQQDYVTGYKVIEVSANEKKAVHFEFIYHSQAKD